MLKCILNNSKALLYLVHLFYPVVCSKARLQLKIKFKILLDKWKNFLLGFCVKTFQDIENRFT